MAIFSQITENQNTVVLLLPSGLSCSMSQDILINWEKKSGERQKEYKKFLHRAVKNKVLKQLPALNEEAFEKIDCLKCANCCKSYSPRFTPPDIKRISKYLGMKEGDFKDTYLVTAKAIMY